jgi:hypothetical protein
MCSNRCSSQTGRKRALELLVDRLSLASLLMAETPKGGPMRCSGARQWPRDQLIRFNVG